MINRCFIIILILFFSLRVNGQVDIDIISYKKYFKIEYFNNSLLPIEVDNISFQNFNDKCKTISYINKKSYEVRNDTLCFNFDYFPSCFKDNRHSSNFKVRKIYISPNEKNIQVFRIPKCDLKKVRFLKIRYITESKEMVSINRVVIFGSVTDSDN